jgi:hypothetical protein
MNIHIFIYIHKYIQIYAQKYLYRYIWQASGVVCVCTPHIIRIHTRFPYHRRIHIQWPNCRIFWIFCSTTQWGSGGNHVWMCVCVWIHTLTGDTELCCISCLNTHTHTWIDSLLIYTCKCTYTYVCMYVCNRYREQKT